jgi:NitT/TauT family transport system substrate-binding protein
MPLSRRAALGLLAAAAIRPARAAAPLRLGLLHTFSPAPFYIAQSKGYFTAEGAPVEFKFFQAAQPIAAAAVAGDIDIGVTALTGGFFSLAAKGALKVIGGALHEQKGHELTAILASKQAYAAGLTSVKQLAGHSFAITQFGSSFHYMLGRLAEAAGFDARSVTLRPVQAIGNMLAAVRSGQVDATMAIASMARPAEASGDVHIIGWVGDYVPYQITALFAPAATLKNRADELHRFCKAYQRGVADYRAAFLRTANGKPVYGPETDAAVAAIKPFIFTSDPDAAARMKAGAGWYDEGGALDVADVKAQLAWFEAQGMVKEHIDAAEVIDTSYLPTR